MTTETEGRAKPAPVQIVIGAEQHAAQQLAAELAAMKAEGRQLNKTVPGGHYLHPDGTAHDAHGRAIDEKGKGKSKGLSGEDARARLAELEEEQAALEAQLQSEETSAIAAAAAGEPSATDEDDEAPAKSRRSARKSR